jgi:5'-AMP-activated protein kinase regulatory beta subunit
MYKKDGKGNVLFSVKTDGRVSRAAVAGDFTGWKLTPMRKQKDGTFAVSLAVSAGRHEYKFILDGNWKHDPDVRDAVHNSYGSLNSVVTV